MEPASAAVREDFRVQDVSGALRGDFPQPHPAAPRGRSRARLSRVTVRQCAVSKRRVLDVRGIPFRRHLACRGHRRNRACRAAPGGRDARRQDPRRCRACGRRAVRFSSFFPDLGQTGGRSRSRVPAGKVCRQHRFVS